MLALVVVLLLPLAAAGSGPRGALLGTCTCVLRATPSADRDLDLNASATLECSAPEGWCGCPEPRWAGTQLSGPRATLRVRCPTASPVTTGLDAAWAAGPPVELTGGAPRERGATEALWALHYGSRGEARTECNPASGRQSDISWTNTGRELAYQAVFFECPRAKAHEAPLVPAPLPPPPPRPVRLGAEESARACGPAWASDPGRAECLGPAGGRCDPATCRCPHSWPEGDVPCALSSFEGDAPDPEARCGVSALGVPVRCSGERAWPECRQTGPCRCPADDGEVAPWPDGAASGLPCAGRAHRCTEAEWDGQCGPESLSCAYVARAGRPPHRGSPGDWVRCEPRASGPMAWLEAPDAGVRAACGPGGRRVAVSPEGRVLPRTCQCLPGAVRVGAAGQPPCPTVMSVWTYPCTDEEHAAAGCSLPPAGCLMVAEGDGPPAPLPSTCQAPGHGHGHGLLLRKEAPRHAAAQTLQDCTVAEAMANCGAGVESCTHSGPNTTITCVCKPGRSGRPELDRGRPCTGPLDYRLACSAAQTRQWCNWTSAAGDPFGETTHDPLRPQSTDVCSYAPNAVTAADRALTLVCPQRLRQSLTTATNCQSTSRRRAWCPDSPDEASACLHLPAFLFPAGFAPTLGYLFGVCKTVRDCTPLEYGLCPNAVYASGCKMTVQQTLAGPVQTVSNCTYSCEGSTVVTGAACDQPVPRVCPDDERERVCGMDNATVLSCTRTGPAEPVCTCAPGFGPVARAENGTSLGECAGEELNATGAVLDYVAGPYALSARARCLPLYDARVPRPELQNGTVSPAERFCALVEGSEVCLEGAVPRSVDGVVLPCGTLEVEVTNTTHPLLLVQCSGSGEAGLAQSADGIIVYRMVDGAAEVHYATVTRCNCAPGVFEGPNFRCESRYYERDCDEGELESWLATRGAGCRVNASVAECRVMCYPGPGAVNLSESGLGLVEVNGTELCFAFVVPSACADNATRDSVCTPETALRMCGTFAGGCTGNCTMATQMVRLAGDGLNLTGEAGRYTPRLVQSCAPGSVRCSCQTLYPNYFPDNRGRPCGRPFRVESCTSLAEAKELCGFYATGCTKRCRPTSALLGTGAETADDELEQECNEAHACRCAGPTDDAIPINRSAPEYAGLRESSPLYRSCGPDLPQTRCLSSEVTFLTQREPWDQCGPLTAAEYVGVTGERKCVCRPGTVDRYKLRPGLTYDQARLFSGPASRCGSFLRPCEDFEVAHHCGIGGASCTLACDTARHSSCALYGSCAPARAVSLSQTTVRVCTHELVETAAGCRLNCSTEASLECTKLLALGSPSAARCVRRPEAPAMQAPLNRTQSSAAGWNYCRVPASDVCKRAALAQVYTGRVCFDVQASLVGERACTTDEIVANCGDTGFAISCRVRVWGDFRLFVPGSCRCHPSDAVPLPPNAGSDSYFPGMPACVPKKTGAVFTSGLDCLAMCGPHAGDCRARVFVRRQPVVYAIENGTYSYNRKTRFTFRGDVLSDTVYHGITADRELLADLPNNHTFPPLYLNAKVPSDAEIGWTWGTVVFPECGCETVTADSLGAHAYTPRRPPGLRWVSTFSSLAYPGAFAGSDWRSTVVWPQWVRGRLLATLRTYESSLNVWEPVPLDICRPRDTAATRANYLRHGVCPLGANGLCCAGLVRPVGRYSNSTERENLGTFPLSPVQARADFEATGRIYAELDSRLFASDNFLSPIYPPIDLAKFPFFGGSRFYGGERIRGSRSIQCRLMRAGNVTENEFFLDPPVHNLTCEAKFRMAVTEAGAEEDWQSCDQSCFNEELLRYGSQNPSEVTAIAGWDFAPRWYPFYSSCGSPPGNMKRSFTFAALNFREGDVCPNPPAGQTFGVGCLPTFNASYCRDYPYSKIWLPNMPHGTRHHAPFGYWGFREENRFKEVFGSDAVRYRFFPTIFGSDLRKSWLTPRDGAVPPYLPMSRTAGIFTVVCPMPRYRRVTGIGSATAGSAHIYSVWPGGPPRPPVHMIRPGVVSEPVVSTGPTLNLTSEPVDELSRYYNATALLELGCAPVPVFGAQGANKHRFLCHAHYQGVPPSRANSWPTTWLVPPWDRRPEIVWNIFSQESAARTLPSAFCTWYDTPWTHPVPEPENVTYYTRPADYLYGGLRVIGTLDHCVDVLAESGTCPVDGMDPSNCLRRSPTTAYHPFFEGLCQDFDGRAPAFPWVSPRACCMGVGTACNIPAGWDGRQGCVHGVFSQSAKACVCDAGWTIPSQEEFSVLTADEGRCLHHAGCMRPVEIDPFSGRISTVQTRRRNTPVCSGRGRCDGTSCQCFEGWGGQFCDVELAWVCPPASAGNSSDAAYYARRLIDVLGGTSVAAATWGPSGRNATLESLLPCGGRGVPVSQPDGTCECRCYSGTYGTWTGPSCTNLTFTRPSDEEACLANGGRLEVHVGPAGETLRFGQAGLPYIVLPLAAHCRCPLAPGSLRHSLRAGINCEHSLCPVGPNGLDCSGRGQCTLHEDEPGSPAALAAEASEFPSPVCRQLATPDSLCSPEDALCRAGVVSAGHTRRLRLCGTSSRYTGCACEFDRFASCVPAGLRQLPHPPACGYAALPNQKATDDTNGHRALHLARTCSPRATNVSIVTACACPFPNETDAFCQGDVCRARHVAEGVFDVPELVPTGLTCNGGIPVLGATDCTCVCPRQVAGDETLRLGEYCQFDVTAQCGHYNGDTNRMTMCAGDPEARCECSGNLFDNECVGGVFRCVGCSGGRSGDRCQVAPCTLDCGERGNCTYSPSGQMQCTCENQGRVWRNTNGNPALPCVEPNCPRIGAVANEAGDDCECLDPDLTLASGCRFKECPRVEGHSCGVPYASDLAEPLLDSARRTGCHNRSECSTRGRTCTQGACSCGLGFEPAAGGTCAAFCDLDNTVGFVFLDDGGTGCVCRDGYLAETGCRDAACVEGVHPRARSMGAVRLEPAAGGGAATCRCGFPFLENCTAHMCQNGGEPAVVGTQQGCQCAGNFEGFLCELARASTQVVVELEPPEPYPPADFVPAPEADPPTPAPEDPPAEAPGSCSNGGTLQGGACLCTDDWHGPACEWPVCGFGGATYQCVGTEPRERCLCVCNPESPWRANNDAEDRGNCTLHICGPGAVTVGESCQCLEGYEPNGAGTCRQVCGANRFRNSAGFCVCRAGWVGSTCSINAATLSLSATNEAAGLASDETEEDAPAPVGALDKAVEPAEPEVEALDPPVCADEECTGLSSLERAEYQWPGGLAGAPFAEDPDITVAPEPEDTGDAAGADDMPEAQLGPLLASIIVPFVAVFVGAAAYAGHSRPYQRVPGGSSAR